MVHYNFDHYTMWNLGFLNSLEISFKHVIFALLIYLILWDVSNIEILQRKRKEIGVQVVEILYVGLI
jgi:hypothetical protein